MAITARAEGTWQQGLIADTAITIPAGAADGDRMFVLASWKDYAITAQITSPAGWTQVTEFADGAVTAGNGVGSMKVACWYKDWASGDTAPTIDFSSVTNLVACAVMVVFQKAAGETWGTPDFLTGTHSWTTTNSNAFSSTTRVTNAGELVIGLAGVRDDSATFTRPATGITHQSAATTWTSNYVEYPATHASTTTGNDMAADAGYRIVNAGGSSNTFAQQATLSAAETGAALWVIQGVSAVPDTRVPYRNPMPPLIAQ